MPLTAGASSHVLVDALKRAGWGPLGTNEFKGVVNVLQTLTKMLDPRSGQGKATAGQIAEQALLTDRWTRHCLGILEDLELIEWSRGGISEGKPVPSWFRVSKKALLTLVELARAMQGERRAERQTQLRERVTRYGLYRTKRGGQTRRSVHAEVNSALLFNKEVPRAERPIGPTPSGPPASREAMKDAVALARAGIQAAARRKAAQGRDSKTAPTTQGATQVRVHDQIRAHNHARPIGGTDQ